MEDPLRICIRSDSVTMLPNTNCAVPQLGTSFCSELPNRVIMSGSGILPITLSVILSAAECSDLCGLFCPGVKDLVLAMHNHERCPGHLRRIVSFEALRTPGTVCQ